MSGVLELLGLGALAGTAGATAGAGAATGAGLGVGGASLMGGAAPAVAAMTPAAMGGTGLGLGTLGTGTGLSMGAPMMGMASGVQVPTDLAGLTALSGQANTAIDMAAVADALGSAEPAMKAPAGMTQAANVASRAGPTSSGLPDAFVQAMKSTYGVLSDQQKLRAANSAGRQAPDPRLQPGQAQRVAAGRPLDRKLDPLEAFALMLRSRG